ncbi:hypothetical protein EDB85DRAFT_1988085, partial [Lactarius pseudohatsudake]
MAIAPKLRHIYNLREEGEQDTATCVSQITRRPSGSASATCSSVTRQALFSRIKSLCLVPLPPHLLDAYCGAGLFSLTFAPRFTQVAGIGLSSDAICFATHNAGLDALAAHEVSFRSCEHRADLQRTAL